MKVIVLGAGVVGATTALVLAERGLDVVLVDRAASAAEGTSHANGSSLTPCHAEPWNPPGTLAHAPGALLHADRPWRIHAKALPGMLGWGRQFLRHSSARRYYRNAKHCTRLGLYSSECLAGLRERHGLEYDQITRGSLELYFNRDDFDQAVELRRRIDLPEKHLRRLDRDELVATEPALAPIADRVFGTLLFPVHESGDARKFSQRAAERAAELGAELRFNARVNGLEISNGRFAGVRVQYDSPESDSAHDVDRIKADACIIATGCDSPALLRPLGIRLPIQPVKGYSATVAVSPDDPAPTLPLLDLERRFVTARLGPERLRIAGLAEFAGFNREIDPRRMQILLESAATLLPDLRDRILNAPEHNAWTGPRTARRCWARPASTAYSSTPATARWAGPTPAAPPNWSPTCLPAGHRTSTPTACWPGAGSAEPSSEALTNRQIPAKIR
ncbi:MAG: FAD-dependent oxidoreductase, partial [Wenzhouxiangellaceae bacterium]